MYLMASATKEMAVRELIEEEVLAIPKKAARGMQMKPMRR
jgi:hypothetical protein